MCNLAIKVKKRLKGRKSFHESLTKSPSTYIEIEISPLQVKALDKGKRIATKSPKKVEGKKCFKCYGFMHFQASCPDKKTLTIRKVELIWAIEEESSEEEEENDIATLVNLNVGELLLIKEFIYVIKDRHEDNYS